MTAPPAEARARSRAHLGYLAVAAAAAGWALIGVFTRRLGARGVPASEVATWRALLGGGCFALQALLSRRGRPTVGTAGIRRSGAELVAFTLVGVVVFFASVPLAVEAGGITLAYVLLYTAPAWVALGAALLLHERLGAVDVVLVAATLLGAALISATGGAHLTVSVRSIGWGLASGITYASYYVLGRRLFDRLGAVTTYALCLPAGGAVLAAVTRPAWPDASSWMLLGGLAVVSTWLPYLCLSAGLARVPSSRAVVVATIEPVLAAVLGATLYGERLGPVGLIGGAVVLGAATIASMRR